MTSKRALWAFAAAAAILASAPASAQSVEAGVAAWQAGDYDAAVRAWRPLADRGDEDAQFNLGHAYRLGRGVPRNMPLAEQWYERAARSGHLEAQAMYGLILFQNGRRQEAMPFVERAAEGGDARAQYVYGTALFNGDAVERDLPRAFAFMSLAAREGLPYAQSQLAEMEQHIPVADRARGAELAAAMASRAGGDGPTRVAAAVAPPLAPARTNTPRIATTSVPPSAVAENPSAGAAPPQSAAATRTETAARPTRTEPAGRAETRAAPPAAASSRWRVQLGAFSNDANARRAWDALSGRLNGLQPFYVRAGNLVRLQAGPLPSRAAAQQACASLRGQGCFPVAP
ncbi:SPOR domain-containing protein [Sphingosinicella sp. CPCC 101087]|uniref:SPOR domain-containing protein n=1 Tax=Sphingosinicella sp. CPCC 101087 TaxID=2497754 RepID=UPI00101B7962|nr:SPOR domain-containing protein [Sphingosinicella sp. CPCC 101087]